MDTIRTLLILMLVFSANAAWSFDDRDPQPRPVPPPDLSDDRVPGGRGPDTDDIKDPCPPPQIPKSVADRN